MEIQLEKLGMTKGEVKVYLALFDLKEGTKYSIARKAEVSASKIYEILDKLIKKGIVTSVIKNNVKHYYPENPRRLEQYIIDKKKEIEKEEEIVREIIPQLVSKLDLKKEITKVELFEGYNGLKSLLEIIEGDLTKGEEWVAMGIRSSKKDTFNNLWVNFHMERGELKIHARFLFTDKGTEYYKDLAKIKNTKIKVLPEITPSGVAVYKNKTMIFYYGEEPSSILITNKDTADSFRVFFNGLWKIAE